MLIASPSIPVAASTSLLAAIGSGLESAVGAIVIALVLTLIGIGISLTDFKHRRELAVVSFLWAGTLLLADVLYILMPRPIGYELVLLIALILSPLIIYRDVLARLRVMQVPYLPSWKGEHKIVLDIEAGVPKRVTLDLLGQSPSRMILTGHGKLKALIFISPRRMIVRSIDLPVEVPCGRAWWPPFTRRRLLITEFVWDDVAHMSAFVCQDINTSPRTKAVAEIYFQDDNV